MATPPVLFAPIIRKLGQDRTFHGRANYRIVIEKPFGRDLQSARELNRILATVFDESQTYRIDHYLAKETAQNIIVFRDGNSLFKKTWNKDFIEKIEITVSEEIGIEGRANFYEQTGALRDLIHLKTTK